MAFQRSKNDPFSPYYNPGGEITLMFLRIVTPMLRFLTHGLECFIKTTLNPSLIPLTLIRDQLFKACLMHLDLHLLLLRFNVLWLH